MIREPPQHDAREAGTAQPGASGILRALIEADLMDCMVALRKSALAGRPLPYAIPELNDLARHCTEKEDDATKVERQVRKSAVALLLSH